MARPTKRFPFDDKYDFEFRPETYWPDLPTDRTFLSGIRGSARREIAERALQGEELEPLGGNDRYRDAMEFVLQERLDDNARDRWGSVHPAMMGGEYLPPMGGDEVEVIRISLQSVTADVVEVRARREGGAIHYRVVDEYETTFEIHPDSSSRPFTFGELIDLIDAGSDEMTGRVGLADGYREVNLDGCTDPAGLLNFVTLTSAFYSQLETYYTDRAHAWVDEKRRAWEENPPPPRQLVRLMTEEEHLAQMHERLHEVAELIRRNGRHYSEEKHVFSHYTERTPFLTEIGFYDDSIERVISEETGLPVLPDGREVLIAYLTVVLYRPTEASES